MTPAKLILMIENYSFSLTEYFVIASGRMSPRRRTGSFINSIETLTNYSPLHPLWRRLSPSWKLLPPKDLYDGQLRL